jgi:hypothetical protein
MDYSSRIKSSSPSIKEITTQENSSTPAADQTKVQTGITSSKDSFEATPANSVFTANPNTGQLRFGDGVQGKIPPTGSENIQATYRYQGLLQQSKTEITNFLKGEQPQDEQFKAIGAYLQMTQKDVRADQHLQSSAKEMSLMSKQGKLEQQNQKIDQGMQEAREKANAAMSAATTHMATGMVSGGLTIASAAAQLQGIASQAKGELAHLNDPAIESRYVRFTSLVTDLQRAVEAPNEKRSDQVQKEINRQEQATNKEQADSSDSAAEDRRKAALDNIQKFLDIIRGMNPQI